MGRPAEKHALLEIFLEGQRFSRGREACFPREPPLREANVKGVE